MMCRSRMLVVLSLTAVCLAMFCLADASQAAAPAKTAARAAAPPSKLAPPVNVNVTVNVRVSHDTKVDVRIEAPFMPVIGSLQLPDFVQRFVGGFFKTPESPAAKAPTKSGAK